MFETQRANPAASRSQKRNATELAIEPMNEGARRRVDEIEAQLAELREHVK